MGGSAQTLLSELTALFQVPKLVQGPVIALSQRTLALSALNPLGPRFWFALYSPR